jgi:hypothetical protein
MCPPGVEELKHKGGKGGKGEKGWEGSQVEVEGQAGKAPPPVVAAIK